MKYCNGCKKEKQLEEFSNDLSAKSGKYTLCKECKNERAKKFSKKYHTLNVNRRNREKYKLHIKATKKLNQAKATGKIIAKRCFLCNKTKTDAHHLDYNYPLKVIWLCRQHHSDVHQGQTLPVTILE